MAIVTKKPVPKNPDEVISSAKAEPSEQVNLMGQKDKTFLLRIPYLLHDAAKKKAGASGISLHDFILRAVNDAVTKS